MPPLSGILSYEPMALGTADSFGSDALGASPSTKSQREVESVGKYDVHAILTPDARFFERDYHRGIYTRNLVSIKKVGIPVFQGNRGMKGYVSLTE
jgi:hypothetical protein